MKGNRNANQQSKVTTPLSIRRGAGGEALRLFTLLCLLHASIFITPFSVHHSPFTASAQGIPFYRNFTAAEYQGNNINFDVETDERGNVFVANFEGLLYYDHAEWRMLHTPGITRVTVLYRAQDNVIWVGGYNYFGKIVRRDNGEIALQRVGSAEAFQGEVQEIYEDGGQVKYRLSNEKEAARNDAAIHAPLGNGQQAIVMKNEGIAIADETAHTRYTISDANGLCSSNINDIAYDGRGHLWGVTNRGIFVIHVPTAISRFTSHEGLSGTVLSISEMNGSIYAGTDDGLYRQQGFRFVPVPAVPHACWDMKKSAGALLAATADGIFRLSPDGTVKQLTTTNSMTLLVDGNLIYSGEANGIYQTGTNGGHREKLLTLENVQKIVKDREGTLWAQSLYGAVWYKKADGTHFQRYQSGEAAETMQTVVSVGGQAVIISAESTEPFPFPLLSYVDNHGVTWLTDNEGKGLYRWQDGKRLTDMDHLLFPIRETPVRTIFTRGNELWLGNDNGLTVINARVDDPALSTESKLYIRAIRLGSDSVLWGGFGEMPKSLPELSHNENNLHFTFSLDRPSIAGQTQYRYRLNDAAWSNWSASTSARFANLAPGDYTFSVQAQDVMNQASDTTYIRFRITQPFYFRWYMNLLYLLLLLALFYALFRLRLKRLEKEKVRLEKLVQERTSQVVRLEKMATVGKLTQGLIDRILNPLNYILNFAKLSEGLVKDIQANVEDEKDKMDEENYEDTMDVLGMLSGNLQKVGEHGQNTTRMLKAMEELLKDRSGGMVETDVTAVLRLNKVMTEKFFAKEMSEHGIHLHLDLPQQPVTVRANPELLSKAFMSFIGNSVYALVKKKQRTDYHAELTVSAATEGNTVRILFHDNGIGIESNIISKVFDPFFTTKTTGEAAGVGLYLCHEIIQNCGGDISVQSVKDDYCCFTVTLPTVEK